jgi:hypothetical protein
MMGLREKERTLASFWGKGEGSTLSDHISGIMLQAKGLSGTKGHLTLSYEFETASACIDEIIAKKNSVV